MRQLGFLEAIQLLIADGWLRLVGGHRRTGFFLDAIHEQTGDVVDGGAVDERLEKVGARSQERQEGDQEESFPIGPRQLEQDFPRAQIVRGVSLNHGYRPMVAGGAPRIRLTESSLQYKLDCMEDKIAIQPEFAGRRAAASVHRLLTGEDLTTPLAPNAGGVRLVDFDAESPGRKARAFDDEQSQLVPSFVRTAPSLCSPDVAAEAKRCLNCSCLAVSPSDLAPALMALEARIETNRRVLDVSALLSASMNGSTVLVGNEIVLAVRIPLPGDGARGVFKKFRARKSIDFPIVNVAVLLHVSGERIARARVCAGAVAPVPMRLHAAEQLLVDQRPSAALCERAALAGVESARPLRKNKYKQQVLQVLVKRSLEEAMGLASLGQSVAQEQ